MKALIRFSFAVVVIGLGSPAPGAPVLAVDGVDMQWQGFVYNMAIFQPGTDWFLPEGWLAPNPIIGSFVVSVGQLMGVFSDGTPIPVVDLVPLTTGIFQVMHPDGLPVIRSNAQGTELRGKVTLLEPQGDISMGIYQ